MIKFLIAIAFVVCYTTASSQKTYSQKLYAYMVLQPKTNIFKSDTATTHATGTYANYLIYIELPQSDTPIWNKATIGAEVYSVHATVVEEKPLVVGERKRDGVLIKIRPQPVNGLWKLEFDMTGEKVEPNEAAADGTVVLKGSFKNRKVSSTVRGFVELNPAR